MKNNSAIITANLKFRTIEYILLAYAESVTSIPGLKVKNKR